MRSGAASAPNQGRRAAAPNAARSRSTMSGGAPAAATKQGMGVAGVELEHADARGQLRRVAGDQQVPVGIQRPDVEASGAHAVEHVARRHEVAVHRAHRAPGGRARR